MKEFLSKLLPKNWRDAWLYFLILVACFPLIYLALDQKVNYMIINFCGLIIFCIIGIFQLVNIIIKRKKINAFKNPAVIFLCLMFLWLFVGSFFAFNKDATWTGLYNGRHSEDSIWQYIFYFAVAVAAFNLKKENLSYLMSIFITIACIIIVIQFGEKDFAYGFINRNHTGYYLCMTGMLAVGMFLFSKKLVPTLLLGLAMALHFVSLVLNGSFGPVLGIIAFFVIGLIYVLIHKRALAIRFVSALVCFVAIFSFFDFVPKVRDLREEETTTISKLYGMGMVVLNKIGIVSDSEYESADVAPGSDGYGRLGMWERSIENMIEMPLFGTGVGSWKSYNPDMPSIKPHNDFLQYGATGGIPTLIFYLATIIYLFFDFRRKHKNISGTAFALMCAIFVYLVQSIFGNVMPFTAPVFYILLGMAIKEVSSTDYNLKIKGIVLEK